MMAGLVEGNNPLVFCGAVIVSPYCAVTTVHCFNNKVVTNLKLLVGDHNYGDGKFIIARNFIEMNKTH